MSAAATRDLVIGIDFAGPATALRQRRKVLAIAAERIAARRFVVRATGFNARLQGPLPGWTAEELADELTSGRLAPSVVAADFPFCVPRALLGERSFAAAVGAARAFGTWSAFNAAIARQLPLGCPVDYAPFRGWRGKRLWLKRSSDRASGAHPPLKDRFQVLFNMTLLGNAFLARLAGSGRYDVVPFQSRGRIPIIEIYPGHAMRALGVPGYKREPARAIDTAVEHLAQGGVRLAVDRSVRDACVAYDSGGSRASDHDAADALVALCVGVLHREGLAREVLGATPGDRDAEGAIWSVPTSRPGGVRPVGRRPPPTSPRRPAGRSAPRGASPWPSRRPAR